MMGAGGDNGASQRAEQQERERQAAIRRGTAAVNAAFDNPQREAQIQEYLGAQRTLYFDALNKQKGDADRQSKFALARDGLIGSRQQVDNAIELGRNYQDGVIQAERSASGDANNLRMADEDARRQLLAMVQSGLDSTTASRRAASSMQTALAGARADMNASALGEVFGGLSDLYSRSRERATERRAQADAQTLYNTGSRWGYGTGGNW